MKKINNLVKIIEDTPVAIRPLITVYKKLGNSFNYLKYECRGITQKIPYPQWVIDKFNFSKYGIGLSYECDNMTKTLVHEAIHIEYNDATENEVIQLTELYYEVPIIRKAAQKRVVYELGKKEL